jgi:outer membrane receptor for ferric coprogen and ferric-rhodotorulic acid
VGANLNWRSETSNQAGAFPTVTIRQPAYALLNLMARYDLGDKVFLTFNLNNVTDKKYLTSRRYLDQGFYGAPRNAMVAVNWKY